MSLDLEGRPFVAGLRRELRHELNALRGNWIALGLALRLLPSPVSA